MTLLLVALGGAVGAALRFLVAHHLDARVPWGTLLVNVVGSFLLGLWSGLRPRGDTRWPCSASASAAGSRRTPRSRCRPTRAAPAGGTAYAAATIVLALVACAGGFVVGQA